METETETKTKLLPEQLLQTTNHYSTRRLLSSPTHRSVFRTFIEFNPFVEGELVFQDSTIYKGPICPALLETRKEDGRTFLQHTAEVTVPDPCCPVPPKGSLLCRLFTEGVNLAELSGFYQNKIKDFVTSIIDRTGDRPYGVIRVFGTTYRGRIGIRGTSGALLVSIIHEDGVFEEPASSIDLISLCSPLESYYFMSTTAAYASPKEAILDALKSSGLFVNTAAERLMVAHYLIHNKDLPGIVEINGNSYAGILKANGYVLSVLDPANPDNVLVKTELGKEPFIQVLTPDALTEKTAEGITSDSVPEPTAAKSEADTLTRELTEEEMRDLYGPFGLYPRTNFLRRSLCKYLEEQTAAGIALRGAVSTPSLQVYGDITAEDTLIRVDVVDVDDTDKITPWSLDYHNLKTIRLESTKLTPIGSAPVSPDTTPFAGEIIYHLHEKGTETYLPVSRRRAIGLVPLPIIDKAEGIIRQGISYVLLDADDRYFIQLSQKKAKPTS